MQKFPFLLLSFLLVSCTLGAEPLEFSTPAPQSAASPTPVPVTAAPTTARGSNSTPTTISSASDPFSANVLQLLSPGCSTLTPQQTEGPYYTAGSPERNVLYEDGMTGEKLIVAGYVLDLNGCQPIPGAWLDFWQADASGVYDNSGYTLRGHQLTDSQGRYFLETVIPGEYPGRTEHIHVKVRPPNGETITSQLYFPNVSANNSDDIFDPALIVTLESREGLYVAYYNFVLAR